MVTDAQVRRLMKLIRTEKTLAVAAAKAGMDEKTARTYLGTLAPAARPTLPSPYPCRTRCPLPGKNIMSVMNEMPTPRNWPRISPIKKGDALR